MFTECSAGTHIHRQIIGHNQQIHYMEVTMDIVVPETENEPTIEDLAAVRKTKIDVNHLTAPIVADAIEQTNISHYRTNNTGHGYAAEDANALNDILRGRDVQFTGKSREAFGPDRIVDGIKIQTKYCKSASDSIDAAFLKGEYSYTGQVIEVPKDQYEQAVQIMRERISKGQVSGVTDPAQAEQLVKEGSITYQQAVNIAKAGNIDSIVFDVKSRIVSTTFAFSLSFAITFATQKYNGAETDDALKAALLSGLQVAGIAMFSGVATAQLLRTDLIGGVGKVVARKLIDRLCQTQAGKDLIIKYASTMQGKVVKEMAARNYAAKMLRSNVVTGTVVTLAMTTPDIYRAMVSKNVSWPQVSKNLVVNASGVAGGMAGAAAGAMGGAALGTMIFPVAGTAIGTTLGGLLGGLGVGFGASTLSSALMGYIVEDDAKEMVVLLPDLLEPLLIDFMLSPDELGKLTEKIPAVLTPAYLRDMYGSKDREKFIYDSFEPLCLEVISERPRIFLPSPEKIEAAEVEFLAEVEQTQKQEAISQLIMTMRLAADLDAFAELDASGDPIVSNTPIFDDYLGLEHGTEPDHTGAIKAAMAAASQRISSYALGDALISSFRAMRN